MECFSGLKHEFEVENSTDSKLVSSVKTAITSVWDKHVGTPEKFHVIFCSHIEDPFTGELSNALSLYDPDEDAFTFALDSIREESYTFRGYSDSDRVLILAAHEATHKVQFNRGGQVLPSFNSSGNLRKDYSADRFEDEAWRESVDLYKKLHPNILGYLKTGPNQRYSIPPASSY